MPSLEIIDTDASTICGHNFCGFKDTANEGYRSKVKWLKKRFTEGLKFKVLQVNGVDAGIIEYGPGDQTWRPIDAVDYLVIHCIMINKRNFKGRGYGRRLIEDCLNDAKRANKAGVAVVASRGSWMAGPDLFQRCGFECVDTAPPSFQLLAKRFRAAPSPKFKRGWDRTLGKHGSGLTIITSSQCPCLAKFTADILDICDAMHVKPKVVELRTGAQARKAPSPYGIFNIVYDGKLLAEHPISGARFRNILQKQLNHG